MATSSLAFLEAWFDRDLDHEVVAYVAHEPRRSAGDQLEALCADFRDWVASRPRLPEPGKDWLRPYLPTRLWHDNRQAVAGYPTRGDWYEDPDQAATDALNAIAHGLLYCDSIAIDDHLVLELDLLNPVADDEVFARARRVAAEMLAFYSRISDLIHAGIVALVQPDPELHNRAGSLDYGDSLWDLAKDGDADLFGPDVSTLDDRFGRLVVRDETLLVGQRVVTAHHGHAMLHVPDQLSVRMLARATAAANDRLPGEVKRQLDEQLRIRQLFQLEVPHLERLTSHDILALRRKSEHLDGMRTAMRTALDRVATARRSGEYPESSLPTIVADELAKARKHVHAEVASTSLVDNVKGKGWLRILSGGAVSSALAASAPEAIVPVVAIGALGAGATAGVELVWRWVASGRGAADRAVENYVSAFTLGTG